MCQVSYYDIDFPIYSHNMITLRLIGEPFNIDSQSAGTCSFRLGRKQLDDQWHYENKEPDLALIAPNLNVKHRVGRAPS